MNPCSPRACSRATPGTRPSKLQDLPSQRPSRIGDLPAVRHRVDDRNQEALAIRANRFRHMRRAVGGWFIQIAVAERAKKLKRFGARFEKRLARFFEAGV